MREKGNAPGQSNGPGSFRFGSRALVFGAVTTLLVVVGWWWLHTAAAPSVEEAIDPPPAVERIVAPPEPEPPTAIIDEPIYEPDFPSELADQPIDAMRAALGASSSFDLTRGSMRIHAFAYEITSGTWSIAFYRWTPDGSHFVRIGDRFGPIGFDAPELAGDPPVLRMREREHDIVFVFDVDPRRVHFEPESAERLRAIRDRVAGGE